MGKLTYLAKQVIGFNQITYDKLIAEKHNLLVGAALRYTFYDDNTAVTQNIDSSNSPSVTYLPGFLFKMITK